MTLSKLSFVTASHFLLSVLNGASITYDIDAESLPTACNNLEDGYHWIRPIAGINENGIEYPNIYVFCNDGWTIIDPSLVDSTNKQHPKYYFTTYADTTEVVASSSINEHVTWNEWWKPSSLENTNYRISEDCNTCMKTDDYGDDSVYYLTGNYIGCLWITKGYCDMDPDTLECYTCSAPNSDEELSGLCTHMVADSNRAVNTAHDDCVGTSYNAEPSIGTNGQYCVCYKPENVRDVAPAKWEIPQETIQISPQTGDTIVQLYGKDFTSGTYRITQPGYYIVMEDIEFNMNAGDYDSPNDIGAWYPKEEQNDYYEGSDSTFVGPYSMGFFAGIAIEADDVTIDLNGYTLSMSKEFHLQQRWFSIIEIGSKAFISGQGPGLFGAFMTSANTVTIRDGTLGLSSHHGIHANSPSNVIIKDLTIKDFEVAGIAINGFSSVQIEDVEIGPVYTEVPVLGVYTQARIMLSRLRKIYADNPEGKIEFHNKEGAYTADDVREELETQMDIVFEHYIKGKEWSDFEDQETVAAARELFENVNQVPSASTVYGIFLNSNGASVFSIGGAPGTSSNAQIKNVKIHGLYNDPWEVPRLVLTKGPFNDIMDLTRITDNGLEDTFVSEYLGSAYSNAQYALHMLSESWTILGHSVLKTKVQAWIAENKPLQNAKMRCNNDIMLHVTKGVFGLRVDNVENFNFENIEIYDLQNVGQLGSYVCGNYESETDGGHRNQNFPLQRGYTGTEVHGMCFVGSTGKANNIKINNLISARGDVYGIQFYPGNEIELGSIDISDLHAGSYLYEDELPENNMPNKVPRACVLDIWNWFDDESGFTQNNIDWNVDNVNAKCTSYHSACVNGDYDSDAVSDIVQECDDSNLISNDAETGEIFEEITESLESSASLMKVLKSQGERIRYHNKNTNSFNNKNGGYLWAIIALLSLASIVGGYKWYQNKNMKNLPSFVEKFGNKINNVANKDTDYKNIDSEFEDTEPLMT